MMRMLQIMNHTKPLLVIIVFFFIALIPTDVIEAGNMDTIPVTIPGNWDPFNKAQIAKLINTYGKTGNSWNELKPPYVVFDWDNTSIFLDIEEATLIYQLENLVFDCTPDQMDTMLHAGISAGVLLADTNTAGERIAFENIATDIRESYAWLYFNYRHLGGGGSLPLEVVKKNAHYANFIAKVRFLYDAVYNTFSAEVAYPWVTFLFAGLDSTRVREMTYNTVIWQKSQPIELVTWTSPGPAELPGQLAGQVCVTWKNGLRLVPEMQGLYARFREAGFDVWICSASFVDVVKEISTNPEFGYNNPASHVLAMELERDANGKILPIFRKGFDQTQGPGKTKAITRFLTGPSGRYGYDPVFIAGDSEGDQYMLSDFKGMRIGLIIKRFKGKGQILGDLTNQAVDSYMKEDARYLLQGRDGKTGAFIPRQQ
jgi:phosphoserine phosphatase